MKKNKNRIALIILSIIILLITASCSKEINLPEPSHDFYVYDELNIIDDYTEGYIIDINKELYEKTGAQIVVAAVDSLEDLEISSYALKLYEKWEIGSREYDNGILILISPNDNLMWVEVGYGLEGQLIDSKVRKIIENNMTPYFADNKYSEGILAGFNQILIEVQKEYDIVLRESKVFGDLDSQNNYEEEERTVFPNIFLIIGVIIFLFIDFTFFRGMLVYSIFRGFGRSRGGSSGSGRGSSGGGGRSGGGGSGGSW